jgi:hypothetical protein
MLAAQSMQCLAEGLCRTRLTGERETERMSAPNAPTFNDCAKLLGAAQRNGQNCTLSRSSSRSHLALRSGRRRSSL